MADDEFSYIGVLREMFIEWRVRFGVFGPCFWLGGYMIFLNLDIEDKTPFRGTKEVLEKLDRIIRKKSKKRIFKHIKLMLSVRDWRPQLVACAAILKLNQEEQEAFISILWHLSEVRGTWGRPQVLATLSLIDKDFDKKGIQILGIESKNLPMDLEDLLFQLERLGLDISIAFEWRQAAKQSLGI